MELSLNMEGDKKLQYLNYFMHRISLLGHYKITPVVVFDGGNIPCKAGTQDERERWHFWIFCYTIFPLFFVCKFWFFCDRRRKENRDLAMEKLKEGDVSAASELFQVVLEYWHSSLVCL